MRRSHRLISLAVLLALSSGLAGCGSLGGWDPTDMFDFLDNKKKLAGERKPVFPEGVPGLEQGVPKSLYKGAQQDQAAVDATPAPPPVEEAKPKRARIRNDGNDASASAQRRLRRRSDRAFEMKASIVENPRSERIPAVS